MQKTFLKFLTYELIERIVRAEAVLDEMAGVPSGTQPTLHHKVSPALLAWFRKELAALKEQVVSERTYLDQLFGDEPVDQKQLGTQLERAVYEPYAALGRLTEMLQRLYKGNPPAEAYLFLKEALPEKFARQLDREYELTVVLDAEGDMPVAPDWNLDGLLVPVLSILQKNNPLAWVALNRTFARNLYRESAEVQAFCKRYQGLFSDERDAEALFVHSLCLRMLGPAYYFQVMADAFLRRDQYFLTTVEPALFFGLNHQDFINKSLVILHEASERSKEVTGVATEESLRGEGLNKDVLAELYQVVDKAIPQPYAFGEKNFASALRLKDRVAEGVLLSGSPLYTLEDVAADLGGEDDPPAIYEALVKTTDHPHTPREIVTAGWLHKVERSPVWLYTAIYGDGFDKLKSLLTAQDHLLEKSIETSEVHRVLVYES